MHLHHKLKALPTEFLLTTFRAGGWLSWKTGNLGRLALPSFLFTTFRYIQASGSLGRALVSYHEVASSIHAVPCRNMRATISAIRLVAEPL